MEPLNAEDPQRIGEYWLAGRLGEGGQGVVYEAYDAGGTRVALKLLHADGRARDRFAKEAAAAARVASFCTARVLAVEPDGRRPYLVSEYVPGPSLRRAGRTFAGDELHRLATAIATALAAIHEAGVIHRDLKPDNVLLGPDGPRVIDFGIARTAEMSLTGTGEVSGTPSYMPPEVFTGQRAGMPGDVFAWGAVVVFAATGEDPFRADNLGGVMHRVLSSRPDLSMLPERLRPLVAAALEKDPSARPAARDLLLALVGPGGEPAVNGVHAVGANDPALGTIAEDAYASLGPQERELAAEVFLRLVTVGEDGQETGRGASRAELLDGRSAEEAAAVARVLRAFAYVVATGEETVELSRPALLRAWPRLRRWVDDDREGLAVLGQITAAARHWEEHGRKDGDLLHGSRLDRAMGWAATGRRHVTLTPRERDFLAAGTSLSRRRARRRTLTSVALAGLLVLATAAGGVALYQGGRAGAQRDVLAAEQAASEADRMRTTDPATAQLLSVAAWRLSPQGGARSALTSSAQQAETAAFHDPGTRVARRALSRDGRTLVSVSDRGADFYDPRDGRHIRYWPGVKLKGTAMDLPVLSADGRYLAMTTSDEFGVWDVGTGRLVLRDALPERSEQLLATWSDTGYVLRFDWASADFWRAYDVTTGGHVAEPPKDRGCKESARSLDGGRFACVGVGLIKTVDTATGKRIGEDVVCDLCSSLATLRFSGDGRRLLAYAGRDLHVWDLATRGDLLAYRSDGRIDEAALDPDGHTVRYLFDDRVITLDLAPRAGSGLDLHGGARLSGNAAIAAVFTVDGRISVWDVRARRALGVLRPEGDTPQTALDTAGTRLVTVDTRITLWDLSARRKLWSVPVKEGLSSTEPHFSPDGRTIIMTMMLGQQPLMHELVLDAATGRVLHTFPTREEDGPITSDGRAYATLAGRFLDLTSGKQVGGRYGSGGMVALSSRGVAASAQTDSRLSLWDTAAQRALLPALPRAAGQVGYLAFSPRGDVLATLTDTGLLQLWDVYGHRRLGTSYDLHTLNAGQMAFSADGATLYVPADDRLHELQVDPERLAAQACHRAGRTLDEQDWEKYLPGVPYRDVCPTNAAAR